LPEGAVDFTYHSSLIDPSYPEKIIDCVSKQKGLIIQAEDSIPTTSLPFSPLNFSMDHLHNKFTKGVWLNKRYETLSPLNHGSFGMVFLARDHRLNILVAVKCLAKPSANMDPTSSLLVDERSEELKIHSRIGPHSNVVNLLTFFETETQLFLILEYCAMGDLYEAIQQDKGPKETRHVRDFMLQLVNAVECLHAKGISHRDIKPENIFLTANGNMKLGDFGLATMDVWSYESGVGSDRYMAPEQFDSAGAGLSPARADIWSLGICLLNILFSRNPFGVPAPSDPLFTDYLRDKQSLFDVFPNMSQDTFEVLTHCLAIDPAKRSLAKVKEALLRVISFTTDDETLDEFCTEDRDVVTATANRAPLRTPSVSSPNYGSPNFEKSGLSSFPWAKALHMTPPIKARQPSIVHDTESISEELFPSSEASTRDWFSKADTQSIDSIVEASARPSYDQPAEGPSKVTVPTFRSKPVPIVGSLPLFTGRVPQAFSSFFGKRSKQPESRSWSDLWDEEEEERLSSEYKNEWAKSFIPPFIHEDSESDGRLTPRACLAEVKNASCRWPAHDASTTCKTIRLEDDINEHTGFVCDDTHLPAAQLPPPMKPTLPKRGSFLAKWTELGERRRAANTPTKPAAPASVLPSKRERLRRNTGFTSSRPAELASSKLRHDVYTSKDWRNSGDKLSQSTPTARPQPQHQPRPEPSQLDGGAAADEPDSDESASIMDALDVQGDDDELGFVGGWKDLHL